MTRCPRCQRRLPPSGECATHGRPSMMLDVIDVEPVPRVPAPPGWRLGPVLASGGTAFVFPADHADGRSAVLKWGKWRDRDIHARFELEAEVLRSVGPPATPAYFDHGVIEGSPYLVMERIPGETIAAWMSRSGERGGIGAILGILDRLAMALASIHAHGIVHRDLKPENALIGPRGVRLLDFGLATQLRGVQAGLTQIGCVVGTMHYLAPEQLRTGAEVDHRADIYSFGIVAFEMLCGRPPFIGARGAIEYHHLVGRPPSVRETRPVPPELDELVLACLAKQPEARPQSAEELRARLARAVAKSTTLRGVGRDPEKRLGVTGDVALTWIDGGDPLEVTRAIADVNGIVVRRRGDGILAAFTAQHHDAPLAVALDACRALTRDRCRTVAHLARGLVRRTRTGKPAVYGEALEQIERWIPATPFSGMLLSAAAADQVPGTTRPAPEVAGFFRELLRDRTDASDAGFLPRLVGRDELIRYLVAAAAHPVAIELTGDPGSGKTRVLDAVADQLRALGRRVIAVRGRRRFLGDLPDDGDLAGGLARAHDAVIVIDDIHHLSQPVLHALAHPVLGLTCIVTAPFAVLAAVGPETRTIELPPLAFGDADILMRELLRPARLLPDVLVERLAIRGAGNPGILVALARDMTRRGAVRRHAGSDEWYVAADELDTLLAPPGPAWFASRALEDLSPELAPVARACAALGARFCAPEVAAVLELPDAAERLELLVRERVLGERDGWYEYADPAIQDALYDHVLDERRQVHGRALRYWQAHRLESDPGWLARLAHHAAGAGEPATAATCWLALERAARGRGDADHAAQLLARAFAAVAGMTPAAIADVARSIE